jgi:hypothetical protein
MRTIVLLGWFMVPVLVGAYHFGPGQEREQLDAVGAELAAADRAARGELWPEAVAAYGRALSLLPGDRQADARQIRIERALAQMQAKQLPEAALDLEGLVEEMQNDKAADAGQLTAARAALANAQYYMTWLMRLEGLGREEWEPVIESARQTFRYLAEKAAEAGDDATAKLRSEDLESTIRLARMEPGELQGLAIPKQCQGCKSGQCKGKGKKPGRNPGKGGEQPKDARGASSGPPPDGSGS